MSPTLIALVALLPTIAGAFYGVRYRVAFEAAKAAGDAHSDNTNAERDRGDRLERELQASHERETALRETIKKLELLPDLTIVVEQLAAERESASTRTGEAVSAILSRFDEHERRSQDRHDAQMKVSQAVLERLAA